MQLSDVRIRNYTGSVSYPEKLHLCTLQNLAMYRESVSIFADLSVTLGAAPRHVQRVRF